MDAADLRVFESVARLGGMNRAAAELNTVQSNVTARIRALEEELGVALFRRHSRGVSLTNAGLRLLPYANRVSSLLNEAKRSVGDDDVPKGPLAIGSLETTAAQRLSPVITMFGKANPGVSLSLKVGTNAALVEQVLNHELDGAFVCAPVRHPDLKSDVVFREELVVATKADVVAIRPVVTAGCKVLVKGPGCAYRERLEGWLQDRGVSEFERLEFGTLEAIISCVEAGLGFTMLPRSVLADAGRAGRIRLHKLAAKDAEVETVFIRRQDVFEFSALRAFLACALSQSARGSGIRQLSKKEIAPIKKDRLNR
jgi:DNA-binding transcriptional LysR family regulator